jgi:Ca2+:H+ antiporter
VASVQLLLYLASLFFSLWTHQDLFRACAEEEDAPPAEPPTWRKRTALLTLVAVTVLVALESDILVSSVTGAARRMGVNMTFIGIIIVAIVGNAAEHGTAVMMALKNKMDITVGIALGSSIQIAMFVAPVLVFGGLILHHPLSFLFSIPELTAIGFSVIIAAFIAGDGKSHWLEGAQLLAAYLIIALAFYFLPP